jgi:DNA-directed RNA polymerase subunit M/transcription elongation factor TFIIS
MWKDADKPDRSQTLLIDIPNVQASDLTEQEKQDLIDLPNLSESEIKAINRRFEPYIFFKKIKKEDYECFCSRCNTTFYASAKKRGDFENCPTCGKEALIVSASYQQKSKNQSINFIVFKKHKITDTVYALCLEVNKIYSQRQYGCRYYHETLDINFKRQPDLKAWVKKIYVFKPGKVDTYMPYYSGRAGQLVYSKVRKRITKPFAGKMYHEAEKEYLNEDLLVQTHLKYYYWASPSDSRLVEWLCICSLYPIAEIAARSQLRIAKDIIMDKLRGESSHQNLVNWRAKSPKKFFKIPFNDVKEFDEIRFFRNIEVLERYAVHYARGEKASFELCDFENNLLSHFLK